MDEYLMNTSYFEQFISYDSAGVGDALGNRFGPSGRSSREITLGVSKKQIESIGAQLGLHQDISNEAYSLFRNCLQRGLTRGRKKSFVMGSLVYMACRLRSHPLMLIEISDALEEDVFEFGSTFLALLKSLSINIPNVGPDIYVFRFATRLQFPSREDTSRVSNTAVRIIKLMSENGINTGRRPSGVCGAALVMAARLHGFNRSVADVINLAKVHESTIRKRMTEFGNTNWADVTAEDFLSSNEAQDECSKTEFTPPAFKAARRKEEMECAKALFDSDNNELNDIQQQIEDALSKHRSKVLGSFVCSRASSPSSVVDRDTNFEEGIRSLTIETIEGLVPHEGEDVSATITSSVPDVNSVDIPGRIEECLTNAMDHSDSPQENISVTEDDGILKFDDLDDDEIDSYILTEEESDNKSGHWTPMYKEFFEEQEKKAEERKLLEEKLLREGKSIKRKPAKKTVRLNEPASSAGEAIQRVIAQKKLSSSIDYESLRRLDKEDDDSCSVTSRLSVGSQMSRKSGKSKSSGGSSVSRSSRKSYKSLHSHSSSKSSSKSLKAKKKSLKKLVTINESFKKITGAQSASDLYQRECEIAAGASPNEYRNNSEVDKKDDTDGVESTSGLTDEEDNLEYYEDDYMGDDM